MRWLALFTILLLGISAVPVLADSLPSEPPAEEGSTSDPKAQALPDGSDVAEALQEVEEQEEEEQLWLESPEAEEEREESQDAYVEVSPSEAAELLKISFAEQLAVLEQDPARAFTGAEIDQVLGSTDALITVGGETMLVEGTMPLRVPTEDGGLGKVSLGLLESEDEFAPANPIVDVRLPRQASDGIAVGDSGLTITPDLAQGDSVAQRFGDKDLLYPETQVDTSLLASPISNGVELFSELLSAQSPEELRFDLNLPADSELRSDGEGGAEVSEGDRQIAAIPAPSAVDAQGADVPVEMQIENNSLVLHVAHRSMDVAYPLLVDPAINDEWYGSNSWYSGANLAALENGTWAYASSDYGRFEWGTKPIYATFGGSNRGLFVSAKNISENQLPGHYGQWSYTAPGTTTWIAAAGVSPFSLNFHGCSHNAYAEPHDYDGLWSPTWSPQYGWTQFQANAGYEWGQAFSEPPKDWREKTAQVFILGLGTGTSGSSPAIPCWRDLYAGGAYVWLSDPEPPAWNSKPTIADQWVDSTSIPVSGSAKDPGLGVKYLDLFTTDSSGKASTMVGSAVHSCSGLRANPCPSSWSSQITNYNPGSLPNGINGMVVIAYDALGTEHYSQGEPVFLKVDHSAPTISYSGDLLSEKPVKYHLNVTGTDGDSGSFAAAQSGMKGFTFYFDGQLAGRYPPGVENPPACKNVQQGIDLGSCKFENVELDFARALSGKHSLKIVATDSLNHSSEKTIELNLPKDTTAPTVKASGALYAASGGWVSQSESSVSIEALDGETGVTETLVYIDGKQVGQAAKQECYYGGCSMSHSFSVPLSGYSEGSHTVKLVAKDGAGNAGEQSWTVKVDSTGPTLNPVSAPEVPSGWTPQVSSFTLKYSAVDASSGIKKVEVVRPGIGGGTVKSTPYSSSCTGSAASPCTSSVEGSTSISTSTMAQGADTVTIKAYDAFEQVSNVRTLTVFVDRTAPNVSATGPLVSASSEALIGLNSKLGLTIQDGGSGVDTIELLLDEQPQQTLTLEEIEEDEEGSSQVCTGETCELKYSFAPIVGDGEEPGPHMVELVVRDKAGQTSTLTHEVTLDTRTPEVTLSGPLADSAGEALASEIATLEVEASDGGEEFDSGIDDIDVEVDGIPIEPKVDLWVVDRANNRVEGFDAEGEYVTKFGSTGSGNGQFNRPTSIAVDASGNIWVADANNNRIQKFNPQGEFLAKFGSAGSGNVQFSGPEGIATDASGNIWVADTYNRRVQKLNEAGEFLSKFGSQGTGPGQFTEANSIDIGPGGKIWVADWGNNRVSQFNGAGEFVRQFGSAGAGDGQFNRPDAIDVDSQGNVWVGDQNNSRVQLFNEAGEYVSQFGSKGSGQGQFSFTYPMGVTTDSNGRIWVTDVNNNRIQKWQPPSPAPTATYSSTFGSVGSGDGQLKSPGDVTVDPSGNIWVADKVNNRIQKFNAKGEFLIKFGSTGSGNGQFSSPASLAIDTSGNVWVADKGNGRVEKFSSAGQYLSQFGSKGSGNGQFTSGGPEGIAIDAKNNIWVSDTYAGRVQEFNSSGEFVRVVSSKGSGEGQLGEPTGIDIGPGGTVWVADWLNNRISVFSETGGFVRQFGSAGTGDGQFNRPDGIDVDVKGTVWVGDQNNGRVQAFNEKGEYLAQFGSKGSGQGQFSFTYPMGIATDNKGGIWIADVNNNRIQKWVTPGYTPTYVTAFGSLGSGTGQLNKPGDIAIASESCTPETCPGQISKSYSYNQGTWGPGAHIVTVTVTDAAGNSASKEVRVNEPISSVAPTCPTGDPKSMTGGESVAVPVAIDLLEEQLPGAIAPNQPAEGEGAPELFVEAGIDPSISSNPETPSIDEQGLEVEGSATGGGVDDHAAGAFTIGQATCLQPLNTTAQAANPTIVNGDVAVFANSAPDTDTVVRPTALGTTIIQHIRGSQAPNTYSWEVGLKNGEQLEELENGDIAIVSTDGVDFSEMNVPAQPSGAEDQEQLGNVQVQLEDASHDIAQAVNDASGEVVAVIDQPEVVLANNDVVPGILKVSGGNVIKAELPPGTVEEAIALIIKANPPAEPAQLCAAAFAAKPELYFAGCGPDEEPDTAPKDSPDYLGLEPPSSSKLDPVLRAMLHEVESQSQAVTSSVFGVPVPGESLYEEYEEMSDEEKAFCILGGIGKTVECYLFFQDKLKVVEMEEKLFNVPAGSRDTKGNAFRHSYWTSLMTRTAAWKNDGIIFAIAHEGLGWRSSKPSLRKGSRMDVLNDFVGYYYTENNETSALGFCQAMLDKVGDAFYLGAETDPFNWRDKVGFEYRHLVFRKKKDLARPGETGIVVLRNGWNCDKAW